jgi:uncharacterized protein (DUF3084 family)
MAQAGGARARDNAGKARAAEKKAAERSRRAQAQYAQAQHNYTQAQSGLEQARQNLEREKQKLLEVNQQLGAKNAELKKVVDNLDATQSRLTSTENDLTMTEHNLTATQRSFISTQKELNAQQMEVDRLTAEQTTLQQRIDSLNIQIEEAAQQINFASRIRTEPCVSERDTVFAAATLRSRLSLEQARAALHDLARQARTVLQKSKTPRQLEIALELTNDKTRVWLDEDELIEQLAIYLTQFSTPVSVRLVAARDHIAADTTVVGRFVVVPVRVIYQRGDTIASAVIDGRQSDALIFRGLLRLTDEGAAQARQRGAVPLVMSRNEPFYVEGTNERIFEALRRIGAMHKPALVRLIADEDILTSQPVKVRFEIEDAPAGATPAGTSGDEERSVS